MAVLTKPIPALYTVYILRSTVRRASLYIGSTPHPPRRLKQHNGLAPGGAARTSRPSLRPWEMVGLVSGFPGSAAALKFEWALTNPHLSLHIPSSSRISLSTQRKKNGHPRRPVTSLSSILSNIHLLLRVPSFARWPLQLHFFAPDVHDAWEKWCSTANEPVRASLQVHTDFGPSVKEGGADGGGKQTKEGWGIHALPLDHTPLRDYVAKSQAIFTFEREGDCVVCGDHQEPGQGLYAVCTNEGCEGTGHLACWGRHLVSEEAAEDEPVLPRAGHCPKCSGEVRWDEMMRELTLRTRGPKEVEKLMKKTKKKTTEKTTKPAEAA